VVGHENADIERAGITLQLGRIRRVTVLRHQNAGQVEGCPGGGRRAGVLFMRGVRTNGQRKRLITDVMAGAARLACGRVRLFAWMQVLLAIDGRAAIRKEGDGRYGGLGAAFTVHGRPDHHRHPGLAHQLPDRREAAVLRLQFEERAW
jgi:hypothetical protein